MYTVGPNVAYTCEVLYLEMGKPCASAFEGITLIPSRGRSGTITRELVWVGGVWLKNTTYTLFALELKSLNDVWSWSKNTSSIEH